MPTLLGVETLEVHVRDPSRIAAFYAQAFALVFERHEGRFVASLGSTRLLIREHPTLQRFLAPTSFEWQIDDARAWARALRERGVSFQGPMAADRDGWADALSCIAVDDPEGNRIWLLERAGIPAPT